MGAGIMFLNRQGEVLAIRRREYKGDNWSGHWDFPGGTSEKEEDPYDTAIRESYEEIGNPVPFKVVDHFNNGRHYRLFLALVEGRFTPILSDEHDAWMWIKPSKLLGYPMHPKDKTPLISYLYRTGKDFAMPPRPMSSNEPKKLT